MYLYVSGLYLPLTGSIGDEHRDLVMFIVSQRLKYTLSGHTQILLSTSPLYVKLLLVLFQSWVIEKAGYCTSSFSKKEYVNGHLQPIGPMTEIPIHKSQ